MWVLDKVIDEVGLDGVFFEVIERRRYLAAEEEVYGSFSVGDDTIERLTELGERIAAWRDLCLSLIHI